MSQLLRLLRNDVFIVLFVLLGSVPLLSVVASSLGNEESRAGESTRDFTLELKKQVFENRKNGEKYEEKLTPSPAQERRRDAK